MGEVEISPRAYVKMCLHAARYPHVAVNGLLLAQKRRPTAAPPECLYITDCVPLFHSNLSLTVMLEVALNQVCLPSTSVEPLNPIGWDQKQPFTLPQTSSANLPCHFFLLGWTPSPILPCKQALGY